MIKSIWTLVSFITALKFPIENAPLYCLHPEWSYLPIGHYPLFLPCVQKLPLETLDVVPVLKEVVV